MLLALNHRMIHLLCTSDRDKQKFLKENWSWIGMYIMRAARRITDVEDGGPFIFAFKKRIAPSCVRVPTFWDIDIFLVWIQDFLGKEKSS